MVGYKDDGYRGIWYYNQPSNDGYAFKYSGGLGTFPSNHIPFAWYSREAQKTFFCYGASDKHENRLLHAVSFYDHERHSVPRPTILLDKKTNDAHDNPVIGLDVDGYVWIFSSSHGTSRPSYIHRSTLPYSIDEFERVKTTNFSYPEVTWLQSRGFFVLFTKYVNHRRFLHCSSSVDGRRWKRPAMVAAIQKGHYQISWSDGTRVGTAFNYHPEDGGLNARTNLYYMETPDAGHTWTTAAGEPVHVPLTNVDNNTRVHDYDRERKLVYLVDMDFDARGFPVILYVTSSGFESGPRNDPRTWTTARWTGGNWVISGGFISHSNYDVGAMYLLEDRRWLIVGPTSAGPQLYNPGGEMDAWESHDQGASWQLARHLTRGSMFNHTYARKPVHAHPEFFTFWADGDTRKLSESRLFFYNCEKNKVFQLPRSMDKDEHFFT